MNVCWLRPNSGWHGDVWLYLSFSDCAAVRSSAVRHRRLSQCLFSFLKLCQTLLFLTCLCSEIFCICPCWLQIGVWAHHGPVKTSTVDRCSHISVDWTDWHGHALLNFIWEEFLAIQQHIFFFSKKRNKTCLCAYMLHEHAQYFTFTRIIRKTPLMIRNKTHP